MGAPPIPDWGPEDWRWEDADDCPSIVTGEPTLTVTSDLHELEGVTEVAGDLVIELTANSPPSLPQLIKVHGKLTITAATEQVEVSTFALPSLQHAGGLTVMRTIHLEGLRLPKLATVTCHVRVQDNTQLKLLDGDALPSLARIGGDLEVATCMDDQNTFWGEDDPGPPPPPCANNPSLTRLKLPALTNVASLHVGNNPRLEQFDAPVLALATRARFGGCARVGWDGLEADSCVDIKSLRSISLPRLTKLTALEVRNMTQLRTLSVPELVEVEDLRVTCSQGATVDLRLSFPKLQTSRTVRVTGDDNNSGSGRVAVLSLPSLQTVDRLNVTAELGSIDLHSLESVTDRLELSRVAEITGGAIASLTTAVWVTVSGPRELPGFPALRTIQRLDFSSDGSPSFVCSELLPVLDPDAYPQLHFSGGLARFDCAEVRKMSGLHISGTRIGSISMPNLTELGELTLRDNGFLGGVLSLPKVKAMARLALFNNFLLTRVDLPVWGPETDSLQFGANQNLRTIRAPALEHANTLSATQNPLWPACELAAWATLLGTTCSCSGNGSCST